VPPLASVHKGRRFSMRLLVIAVALAVLHWVTSRSDKPRKAAAVIVAVLAPVRSRCGANKANARRPHATVSGLLERFDLQRDGDLVADDRATRFQRHVDIDAEVLAVQHD
jgi:hypothetical protein